MNYKVVVGDETTVACDEDSARLASRRHVQAPFASLLRNEVPLGDMSSNGKVTTTISGQNLPTISPPGSESLRWNFE